ncbi:related to Epoxide hydrolase 1 [Pseudozyma flocculosa]|uniref:Related to Epoxide hydrolase 1 n=1 Tax=Pseudozyma flocculosa TaxID=84751 RepID=A0A5C3FBT1_9BASI|nr:related to Epoxide hydrolase 1 [Pseudozyma flocculosa]
MVKHDCPPITPPEPFTVSFSADDINEFKHRLETARLPDDDLLPAMAESRDTLHQLRPSKAWMQHTIDLWRQTDFDQLLAKYNRFDHFTTSVDWCRQLHFVHKRSSRADAIPIILVHGWPGSWYEFAHVIDDLAEPNDPTAPAFHVVVPSLPGFGGDWGSPHARALGVNHAEEDGTGCRAVHLNFCPVTPTGLVKLLRNTLPASVLQTLASYVYDAETMKGLAKGMLFESQMAYYHVQKLRPTQLLYGLIDSPVGILGWLGYFYDVMTSSKPDHPTLNVKDLLETATLFHFTKSIGSSFLPYTNNPMLPDIHGAPEYRLKVPLGYSDFPDEIFNTPRGYVDRTTAGGRTRWIAKATRGGHFAALEEPTIFASHLRNAFSPGGQWTGHHDDGIRKAEIDGGLWDEVRKSERNKL